MECLLKQAKATAKLYGEDSFAKGVQSQIARLFETLNLESQDTKSQTLQKISAESLLDSAFYPQIKQKTTQTPCLTIQDKAKIQAELREFFADKKIALDLDFEIPPTLLAVKVYEKIGAILKNPSPYQTLKKSSIATAREYKKGFLEILSQKLAQEKCDELGILTYALKICVLGNILDYGAQCSFDLEEESQKILSANFAYFDLEKFAQKLQKAKNLVFIGDNAGENEFDEILIVALKSLYPHLEIFYFVRGAEIINDITLQDLKKSDSRLFALCRVVDSGVLSPGFIESLANTEAKKIYHNADVVLAKGMGNFESMEKVARSDSRIFFLFKIKCEVVRRFLQKNLGDFVFWNPSSHKAIQR